MSFGARDMRKRVFATRAHAAPSATSLGWTRRGAPSIRNSRTATL